VVVTAGPGLLSDATDVARLVNIPDSGGAAAASVAPVTGRAIIESAHFVARAPEGGSQLTIGGLPGLNIVVNVFATAAPLAAVVSGGDRLERTTVRGHTAIISSRTRDLGGAKTTLNAVAWTERPGMVLMMTASAPPEQLLPIAAGLRAVSGKEWARHVPVAQGAP
jgi:hypothetical protein